MAGFPTRPITFVVPFGPGGIADLTALGAPPHTPPAVLLRLNEAINAALQEPAIVGQLRALGARPLGGPAGRMQAHLAAETRRWAAIIRSANITAE